MSDVAEAGEAPFLALIADTYAHRLKRFGPSARGVFWRHQFGQYLRFAVLFGIVPQEEYLAGGLTFNDLGCGYGAFYDYLADRPEGLEGGIYYGYDICPAMVEASRRRIRDPRARFEQSDRALHAADYSFVSGTYNMKLSAEDESWNPYVKNSLKSLWSRSLRGLAFNMLDIDGRIEGDGLYYARAEDFVDFCRNSLSSDVRLVSNSPLREWTIYIRR